MITILIQGYYACIHIRLSIHHCYQSIHTIANDRILTVISQMD